MNAIQNVHSASAGGGSNRTDHPQHLAAQNRAERHVDAEKADQKKEEVRMTAVSMTVNGKPASADVEDRTLLVHFLRENLGLTGTHIGCDTSQCGACVVLVDGVAVKSCTMLAGQAAGASITTIEGLAANGQLHPMQQAFHENHGLQCGFCTPGMIMTAVDMVRRLGKRLDEATVRHELEGNICRCTGYHNIVKAIQAGAASM
jgi:carbon-monoxide dehydrogenase small subunit